MDKRQRAQYIRDRLEQLYPVTKIPLDHRDPYTLLVAVVLSAQCTDKKVNEVTPQLFALADTPAAMARLPVEEIQAMIRPLGLAPQKAKAISRNVPMSSLSRDHSHVTIQPSGHRNPPLEIAVYKLYQVLEMLPVLESSQEPLISPSAGGSPSRLGAKVTATPA